MYIEVTVEGQAPKLFEFSKNEMSIGASKSCDIVVPEVGISRIHLVIVKENDRIFAIDQGSTNGSYLNEEKLVPQKKAEFNTFFPIRLASSVLVSIQLEKDKGFTNSSLHFGSHTSTITSTKMLRVKESDRKALTESLMEKKKKAIEEKKLRNLKSKKKSSSLTYLLVLLIIGGSVYYQFFMDDKAPIVTKEVKRVGVIDPSPRSYEKAPDGPDVPRVSKEKLQALLNDIKCVVDAEIKFCNFIPSIKTAPWGAVQVGSMLNVLVDGTIYAEEAKKIFEADKDAKPSSDDIKLVTAYLFLQKALPVGNYQKYFPDLKFTFALFYPAQNVYLTIGTTAQGLESLKQSVNPGNRADQNLKSFEIIKKFVKIY